MNNLSKTILQPLKVLCFEPLPVRITFECLNESHGEEISCLKQLLSRSVRAIYGDRENIEHICHILSQALKKKELLVDEFGPGGLSIRIIKNLLDYLGKETLKPFVMTCCGTKVYDFIEKMPYYQALTPKELIERHLKDTGITGLIEEFHGYSEQLSSIEYYDKSGNVTEKQFICLQPDFTGYSSGFISRSIDFIKKEIDMEEKNLP